MSRRPSCPPSALAYLAASSRVRAQFHTMALWCGLPVLGSHTTVVSRWFVTPTAARSDAASPADARAPEMHA